MLLFPGTVRYLYAQDESEDVNGPGKTETSSDTEYGFNAQDVESTIAELNSDGTYTYDETALDDPPWLLRIKEWWRNFLQRFLYNPPDDPENANMRTFSYLLIGAIILLFFILFLYKLLGKSYTGVGEGSAAGVNGEFDIPGSWGDTGATKASELAASGQFREAISVLFKSALRGLSNVGWINYRSSDGSRMYLRQLRRSADLYPVYRDFLGFFEVAYYRKGNPTDGDWRYLFESYGNLARIASTNPPRIPSGNRFQHG